MINKYKKEFDALCNHFFGEGVKESSSPCLMFLFSAPGAGKTTNLIPKIKSEFPSNERPVVLEVDELKAFLPQKATKKEKNTLIDIWVDKVVNKAISDKRNIMIVRLKNMLLLNETSKIYKDAKKNGYHTEAVFLAINKKKSRLGVIYRYEQALANSFNDVNNYPRKPCLIKHYIFFKATPIMLNVCEKNDNVDVVRVFDNRVKLLAHNNKLTGDKSAISTRDALSRERRREWTPEEERDYQYKKEEVAELKLGRKTSRFRGAIFETKLKYDRVK